MLLLTSNSWHRIHVLRYAVQLAQKAGFAQPHPVKEDVSRGTYEMSGLSSLAAPSGPGSSRIYCSTCKHRCSEPKQHIPFHSFAFLGRPYT